jgi:ankyrin repeat protein
VGVGPDPEAMLWQLQQQQQMVFQQMQQLQLAQQQQQRRAHAGYLHAETASANGFGADDGSRPPPNAFDLVRRNAVEEVTRLVETRLVSVHQLDADGNSLLMWACARGHRRLTKFLLKRGAAVNGRNAVGDTPLHFCLAGGHGELGAYLVAKGADEAAANDRGATPYEGMV